MPTKKKSTKGGGKRRRGRPKAKGSKKANQALVKALAHGLRAEILAILNERTASPVELAKELGEGLSQVSYHVKVLREYKVITLVKKVQRRGAFEHYYRATSRVFLADRKWDALAKSAQVGMSADLFEAVIADAVAAMEAGTFDDRANRHLSWTPLVLDEKGWTALQKLLDDTQKRVAKLNADAAKRLRKAKGEGIPASVAMLGYEVPESAAKKSPARKAAGGRKGKAKAKKK